VEYHVPDGPAPAIIRTELSARSPDLRPGWARHLDAIVLRLSRIARLAVSRPADSRLEDLARRDRPAPVLPPDPTGPLQRGRNAFERGQWAEALHCFGEVLANDPDHPWGWHGRGDALQLLGDPAGALHAYDRAVDRDPDCGLHHGGRANALAALGRLAEAEAAWQAALARDPTLTWMRGDGRRG